MIAIIFLLGITLIPFLHLLFPGIHIPLSFLIYAVYLKYAQFETKLQYVFGVGVPLLVYAGFLYRVQVVYGYFSFALFLLFIGFYLYHEQSSRIAVSEYVEQRHAMDRGISNNELLREILNTTFERESVEEVATDVVNLLMDRYPIDYCTIFVATNRGKMVVRGTNVDKPYIKALEDLALAKIDEVKEKNAHALIQSSRHAMDHPCFDGRGINYTFFIPIEANGVVMGAILVENRKISEFASLMEESFFKIVLDNIHVVLTNALYQEKIVRSAMVDELTGVYNRNYMDKTLPQKLDQYKNTGKHFTLAILDIDHFKKFNDTYGHLFGDLVLKEFAQFFKGRIRDDDYIFRYGGEEFIIFFADTVPSEIFQRLDTLRQEVSEMVLTDGDGRESSITASFGLSEYPSDDVSVKGLIEKADQALYTAKKGGRNRICVFQDIVQTKIS